MSQLALGRDLRQVRSVMETPILDDRKWSKIPSIAADCFMLDLEDTVVPAGKPEPRRRVVEHLREPSYFGGRLVAARPNNLATPWGRDDIVALAHAGVTLMAYPKAHSADEVREVLELARSSGADPGLLPIIETAGGLMDVREIAAIDGVVGLFTGIGDLSVDAGIAFRTEDGAIHPSLVAARTMVVFAAAAHGIPATDSLLLQDLRDDAEVAAAVLAARQAGFSTLATFYPPHVERINALLRPQRVELDDAADTVTRYEAALSEGRPAVVLEDGRTIMALDYQRALKQLAVAGSPAGKEEIA